MPPLYVIRSLFTSRFGGFKEKGSLSVTPERALYDHPRSIAANPLGSVKGGRRDFKIPFKPAAALSCVTPSHLMFRLPYVWAS